MARFAAFFAFALLCSIADGRRIFKSALDDGEGDWTVWYDSDNPHGDVGGDWETINHINGRYGTGCDRIGVPCRKPTKMEVELSPLHVSEYPNADFDEIMQCSVLTQNASDPTIGFYCLNQDQTTVGENIPNCLGLCKKNGQHDKHTKDQSNTNCNRCANFQVRYFCRFEDHFDNCPDRTRPPTPSAASTRSTSSTAPTASTASTPSTVQTDAPPSHGGFELDDIVVGDLTLEQLLGLDVDYRAYKASILRRGLEL